MPECLPLGATVLLPKTVGDFTNPLRVIPFVLREPTTLDLREVLRIMFRHKSQGGLESWPQESEQVDKWIFCLTPARLAEDQELR